MPTKTKTKIKIPIRKDVLRVTIEGELGSKSNSRRIVSRGRHSRLIKSDKALKYEKTALEQLQTLLANHVPFEQYVSMTVDIYYASRRPDLDVALLQDILQHRIDKKTGELILDGAYMNDRQVVEIHARKFWDKEHPRVECIIHEIDMEERSLLSKFWDLLVSIR